MAEEEQPTMPEEEQPPTEVEANPQEDPLKDGIKSMKSMFRSDARNESNKLFRELDGDRSKSASHEEIAKFVASNDQLWALLSVNLDQPKEVATEVATRVAMELATELKGEEAMNAELNKDQFHNFRKKYILDPTGSQEFFFRAVFASFDKDSNAVLDEQELDQFLEIFYKSGSTFQGSMGTLKLPPKEKLHEIFLKEFDENDDKELSFEEVRVIISGQVNPDVAAEIEVAAAKAEAEAIERSERLEEERLEQERLEKERLEAERIENERLEKERLEKEEAASAENAEKEGLEAERVEKERLEKEKLEEEKAEADRIEEERRMRQQEEEEQKRNEEKLQEEQAKEKAPGPKEVLVEKEEDDSGCPLCEWLFGQPTPAK
ncbi:RAD54-like 2 (Saccharomyces cerevisiae) [Seminavis robusta]|uniref:RAD54-like 2 (Saccharomyces cerevisiae) n=1 Tax=Seminavis robusta TaxID=568900 RepID=A0A9N8EAU5_9STRA|nr:RAD54-like 2 (Saccharomyces cerevisiae) [Seminavis robusta]|eukprot:Sro688_g187450.1 RAD54-like 2 (Saccharomyces cerevisiae) (378) ;mRNA; f:46042-47175